MELETLVVWLIIGAVAGFLAGQIVKGYGFGWIGNIIVGIVGAVVAGYFFPQLGWSLEPAILGQIIAATIGAVLLLVVIGLVKKLT